MMGSTMRRNPLARLVVAGVLALAATGPLDALDLTQNPQDNWPTDGGSFSNQRFAQLDQVTRANVASLRVKWALAIPDAGSGNRSLETTPLVVRGGEAGLPAFDAVMFVTSPLNQVLALDAGTGGRIWNFAPPLRVPAKACCGVSNRGVAFGRVEVSANAAEPRVYVATLDARLWAIDAATGQPKAGFGDGVGPPGSVTVADNRAGFSITMAPLFIPKAAIPS